MVWVIRTVGFRPKLKRKWYSSELSEGNNLLVISEAPNEASYNVAYPEDCLDDHGLVVVFTDPVILTGDCLKDAAMVILPAVVTSFGGAARHKADNIAPREEILSSCSKCIF